MPRNDTFWIVRPDEMWTYTATTTGTVAADYDPSWLTDAKPGRPVRAADGSPGGLDLDMTGPSGQVDIVAIHHHNLIVPVTIGGDINLTLTPASVRPPNGVQLNPFELVSNGSPGSPVGSPPGFVDHLTLSVSGNDETEVIGEFLAGVLTEITPVKIDDAELDHDDFMAESAYPSLSVLPFDDGEERRMLRGSQYYSLADLEILKACWQAQRAGTRPMLLIPDSDVNDAWVVLMNGFNYRPRSKDIDQYLISFEFVEYPRSRW